MLTGTAVSILLIVTAILVGKNLKKTRAPKGAQNIVELVIEGLLNLMIGIAGEKKAKEFFPVISTLFLYILISNWTSLLPGVGTVGITKTSAIEPDNSTESLLDTNQIIPVEEGELAPDAGEIIETPEEMKIEEEVNQHSAKTEEAFIPFVRPPSADLNATIGLALISVIGSQIIGYKYLKMSYFTKFFNFKNPGKFVLGILELTSEISRIISFAFRLFGNIFAGEVLLSVSLALLPFLAPLPFLGLEIFVGAIQALVFAILTLVFWQMATVPHNEQH